MVPAGSGSGCFAIEVALPEEMIGKRCTCLIARGASRCPWLRIATAGRVAQATVAH